MGIGCAILVERAGGSDGICTRAGGCAPLAWQASTFDCSVTLPCENQAGLLYPAFFVTPLRFSSMAGNFAWP